MQNENVAIAILRPTSFGANGKMKMKTTSSHSFLELSFEASGVWGARTSEAS